MLANKIFFDLYSTSGGSMSRDDYKKYYDSHDTVFILLMDAGIYTIVHRQTMFDHNMHHGCFIEHYSFRTPEEVQREALHFVDKYNLKRVEPSEFMRIEKENDGARVAKAFAKAEELIKQG